MNALRGWRGYIALSLVWVVVLAAALLLNRRPAGRSIEILPPPTLPPTATPVPTATSALTATPGPLHVDVAGAVKLPGVYRLPPGSLVADAIAAAGGPAPDADLDRINKAVLLQDGMQVYVPRAAEPGPTPQPYTLPEPTAAASPGGAADRGPAQKININTASAEELDTLPGIGPAMAQRIIEGRPYSKVEDLMRVKGIGQATFDKLKEFVTVQ
jgi:competence protein ComEA